ncbi:MAG: CAP domain-containing protein [Desulfitobacteriaceae bacterium]
MSKKLLAIVLALILLDPTFNRFWAWTKFLDKIPESAQRFVWTEPRSDGVSTPQAVVNLPLPAWPSAKASQADVSQVERMVLNQVNQDREKAGLSPVIWDETAAKAARQHVQEEADIGYISHWGMDGKKPQERYTLAGGLDAVEENESVSLWLEGGFRGVSKENLYNLVKEHERAMVNERPPDDGHRKNILDSHHTGVGIAIAVGKYGIAMAQEFTNHYSELKPLSLSVTSGSKIPLSGRVFQGYQISGVYAVWEEPPHPMSKEELMRTHSYSDPPFSQLHFWAKPRGSGYYIPASTGNIFAKNLTVDRQGNFSLEIPLVNQSALDYISLEISPIGNSGERFYTGQFVLQH